MCLWLPRERGLCRRTEYRHYIVNWYYNLVELRRKLSTFCLLSFFPLLLNGLFSFTEKERVGMKLLSCPESLPGSLSSEGRQTEARNLGPRGTRVGGWCLLAGGWPGRQRSEDLNWHCCVCVAQPATLHACPWLIVIFQILNVNRN